MFGMQAVASPELVSMRAGKMNLEGTTVTADERKGLLVLRKSDDGLMHLIWKDRGTNVPVDDFIVFEGDATIRRVEECKDGFAMLVEFSQMDRKLFFYSQEPRKKGSGWEDTSKEKALLDKVNAVLTGQAAAGAAAPGSGALGMTQAELLAMLGSAVVPATSSDPASAAATPSTPAAEAGSATTTPGAPTDASFSANAISNILSSIPAAGSAPSAAQTPAAGFSADAISSILSGIGNTSDQPASASADAEQTAAAPASSPGELFPSCHVDSCMSTCDADATLCLCRSRWRRGPERRQHGRELIDGYMQLHMDRTFAHAPPLRIDSEHWS